MSDPFSQFSEWLEAAKACKDIAEPTAMTLATCNAKGQPSLRVVLLKSFDERGFVFYTNTLSHKGRDLSDNAKAALGFYWMPIERQVRIEGVTGRVSDAEADAYFATRLRESQIGAWASQQSEPLASTQVLQQAVKEVEARFAGKDIPRPPHWSGYRVLPSRIEFWQQAPHRLHDRELFEKCGDAWVSGKLFP